MKQYEMGNPYINLALNILSGPLIHGERMADKYKRYRIYRDFMEEFHGVKIPNPLHAALFVSTWLKENHTVKGQCLNCNSRIEQIPQCKVIKAEYRKEKEILYVICLDCGLKMKVE